jgi:hypothetical protein
MIDMDVRQDDQRIWLRWVHVDLRSRAMICAESGRRVGPVERR